MRRITLCLLPIILLALAAPALAQAETLTLYVRRTFGYSGGSQIQGSFRLEAAGPADLAEVTFRIDGQVVGTDAEPPFRVDFKTDDYGLGWHAITATGQTAAGETLEAAPRRFEFVSASAGWTAVRNILAPIIAVVLLAALLAAAGPLLAGRRGQRAHLPPGTPRSYGAFGGAICRHCGRPFSRHWWAPNLGMAKYDRCDNCGRWSVASRASPEALAAAEAAELARAQAGALPAPDAQKERRRAIDDSRYSD